MLLTDWLSNLRAAWTSASRKNHRRKFHCKFATAAEVLQERTPPSESVMSLVGGGLLMGLMPESPGDASPSLMESFWSHEGTEGVLPRDTFSPNSTFFAQPPRPEPSSNLPQEEGISYSQPNLASPAISGRLSNNETLPAVLDDLLSSGLHEHAVGSPHDLPRSRGPLPSLSDAGNVADQDSNAPNSAGNVSSGAPTSGLGNTHPVASTPAMGDGFELDADTLSAAGPAVPTQAPAPRQHGEIEPLQIEKQSEPVETSKISTDTGDTSFSLMGSGNGAPDAQTDSFAAIYNTDRFVSAPGVLQNDTDPDGDPLTASLVTPTRATVRWT